MSAGTRLLSGLVMTSCFLLLVVACNDDYELPFSNTSQNAPEKEKDKTSQWLQPYDDIAPEDWLIIRSQAALRGEVTSRQHRIDILHNASQHFRESPRMVANRAAQLEDMLLEIGIKESAVSLIDQFSHLPTKDTPHNFSAYCQYYFNLRSQGHDHDYALNELSKLK